MLLIKNGKLMTMTGMNYDNGSILIKDGVIAEIGIRLDVNEKKVERVIDAQGGWVLPGLIDAHCHIGISEEKKGFEGMTIMSPQILSPLI
jgi:imidazolonepropionase-like amidohydrolase